jgi:hypothetical protein
MFRRYCTILREHRLPDIKTTVTDKPLIWQPVLPEDGALAPKHVAALCITLIVQLVGVISGLCWSNDFTFEQVRVCEHELLCNMQSVLQSLPRELVVFFLSLSQGICRNSSWKEELWLCRVVAVENRWYYVQTELSVRRNAKQYLLVELIVSVCLLYIWRPSHSAADCCIRVLTEVKCKVCL